MESVCSAFTNIIYDYPYVGSSRGDDAEYHRLLEVGCSDLFPGSFPFGIEGNENLNLSFINPREFCTEGTGACELLSWAEEHGAFEGRCASPRFIFKLKSFIGYVKQNYFHDDASDDTRTKGFNILAGAMIISMIMCKKWASSKLLASFGVIWSAEDTFGNIADGKRIVGSLNMLLDTSLIAYTRSILATLATYELSPERLNTILDINVSDCGVQLGEANLYNMSDIVTQNCDTVPVILYDPDPTDFNCLMSFFRKFYLSEIVPTAVPKKIKPSPVHSMSTPMVRTLVSSRTRVDLTCYIPNVVLYAPVTFAERFMERLERESGTNACTILAGFMVWIRRTYDTTELRPRTSKTLIIHTALDQISNSIWSPMKWGRRAYILNNVSKALTEL